MGQPVKKLLATTLTTALLLGISAPLSAPVPAHADGSSALYTEAMEKADHYGLLKGYPNGSFGADRDMTRGEFMAVLCRMFGWETSTQKESLWSDCEKHWSLPYFTAAADHGLSVGDGTCHPDEPLRREDAVVLLITALGLDDIAEGLSGNASPFSDATDNAGYLTMSYDLGLTDGIPGPDGTTVFLPDDSVCRGEVTTMLVTVYERINSDIDWLHAFYAFSSYSQIDFVDELDALSVGWARLCIDPESGPWINSTSSGGNDWSIPKDPSPSLERFEQAKLPYHLNVFADTTKTVSVNEDTKLSVLNLLLTDEELQQAAIDVLVAAAENYAGLTIDFEGLISEEYREPYSSFMAALRAALPEDKALWVCVPPDTWYYAYDYRALGEVCDKVILMAHDYQWTSVPEEYLGTTNTYSPVTPLSKIYTALQHITDPETGVQNIDRVALQISFGTAGFQLDEDGCLLSQRIYHPAPDTIAKRLLQQDTVRIWDESSRNPYILYTTEEGESYKLWYEDEKSVSAKLSLCKLFGVTGISVWRMGIIPHDTEAPYYDVWSTLAQR